MTLAVWMLVLVFCLWGMTLTKHRPTPKPRGRYDMETSEHGQVLRFKIDLNRRK